MKRPKYHVIINPLSKGGKTRRKINLIINYLIKYLGEEFSYMIVEKENDAKESAKKALLIGVEKIIAVGRDGTFQNTVNGFFENQKIINPNEINVC